VRQRLTLFATLTTLQMREFNRATAARYLCRRAASWFKVSTPTENPMAA
jgi:hypothetical protein